MAWVKQGNIKGPKGDQGVAGGAGPPGPPGPGIIAGASAPTGGKDGDFFYRTDTHVMYGPKVGGVWPSSGYPLQGPQGAPGHSIDIKSAVSDWAHLPAGGTTSAPANQPGDVHFVTGGADGHAGSFAVWALKAQHAATPVNPTDYEWRDMGHLQGPPGPGLLAGTGAPTTSLGQIGDLYFDKSAKNLYGPKAAAGWGAPIPLVGASGVKGDRGFGWFVGHGAPTTVAGTIPGDLYLDDVTGDVYRLG
jgi:hypothetical protein